MNKVKKQIEIIRTESVEKVFQNGREKLSVLHGIDLFVDRSEVISITGESGSGKSTFLNILGGLDKPSAGKIIINGKRIDHLPEDELTDFRKRTVGFIFQFHFLLKDFTALENVLLPGYIAGKAKIEAQERAAFLLEQVFLKERMGHYPNQLSGGERQRVAVARALMNGPDIILADEPTGNLDESNSRNVEEILFNLVSQFEKTMVLVTHDPELAKRGDEKFHLQNGKLEKI